MLKLTPTWCGPLTTPGVLNLTPEFLQCGKIRINDIKYEMYLLTFSSDDKKTFEMGTAIFCSRPEMREVDLYLYTQMYQPSL